MPCQVPFPFILLRTVSFRFQRNTPEYGILEFGGWVPVDALSCIRRCSLERHGLSGYFVPGIVLSSGDTKKEAGSFL